MQKIIKYFFTTSRTSHIPTLKQFVTKKPLNTIKTIQGTPTYHIQTHGCQMNSSDTQIIKALLNQKYTQVDNQQQADIWLLNTCAIRQKPQEKVIQKIRSNRGNQLVGVLGCMAQRLKDRMFKQGVHVVCGPDAYRDLPRIIDNAINTNKQQMNVQLSFQQTYADISPVRKTGSVTAFLSIMRGCNNMCSFCIVPFVRGRQRSTSLQTILQQIGKLQKQGIKDITFLGQNVNSYHDITNKDIKSPHHNTQGFSQMFKLRKQPGARFADLIQQAAIAYPNIRFRFTSPHPKDFPQELLHVIAKYNNVCNFVHLPAQSGNTQVLTKMRRNYSRQAYLSLVDKVRKIIPNVGISTDLICGFCGQTQQQFKQTLSLIKQVKFDMAFQYAYSMRQGTHAHRNYVDDVPNQIKQKRLKQMIDLFVQTQTPLNQQEIGKIHLLLLQGKTKRQNESFLGKTDNYKSGYVDKSIVSLYQNGKIIGQRQMQLGDFVAVTVTSAGPRALFCKPLGIVSTINQFYQNISVFQTLSKGLQKIAVQ